MPRCLVLARVWSWLAGLGRRLSGGAAEGEEPAGRDVVQARARFWAELREGQREADARLPTRRS